MKNVVNNKKGISLLVLAITIIVIVSLAGIAIFYSINAPINASKAKFFNTVTEVEAAVKLKRLETGAPQGGGDENLLFTEVIIRGRVPENYTSTSNSEIKGYVVNLDVIQMNELNIGKSTDVNEVVFGETDAFIYDATGKVYYAAGYIIKEEIYYTETDKETDGTGHIEEVKPSIEKYTITYVLNGGIAIGNPSTYLSNMASNIILQAPTKEGRTFLGWIGSNGDTPQINIIINKGSKGNKTYEAIWLEDEYAITYELNGGTASNPSKYDIRSETISLNIPIKTGSIFLGWTGSNGSIPDASVEIKKGSIGNKHYVANWTEEGYAITYELNGGTINNPGGYTSNTEVILNNPTREGYLFRGWTGSNGNVAQMQVIIGIGSIGNKHYIANWLEEEYEITYELNGGTVNNPVKYKVTSSTFVLNNPIRQRYTFIGWTGSNGTVPTLEVIIEIGSTGNKNYVANWEPIKLIKNPTVTINNGDIYTNSRNIILNLSAANADYVYIKEQNTAPQAESSGWLEYNASKEYVLSTGDGVKTVYVWYKTIYGEITEVCSDTITLDTVKPVASNVLVGEMLYKDPTFETGINSVGVYNNSGGGTVTHQRVSAPAGTPTDSGYIMRITTAGTASPGLGGYIQSTLSKAGAIFIHRIIAKIPAGYTLQRASNKCGDGVVHAFHTPVQGTGEWEEYIYTTTCGTTGTFSTMGHLYINGPAATAENPVTWEVAYSTIYEVGAYGKRQGVFYEITDERSGIVGHGLNQSSTVAPTYKTVSTTSEIASMAESITANGTYYIWGKDAAGNQKSQSVAVNKIDTVVPVNFTVTATVDSSTKVTVSGSTTDALSGLHATPYAFSKDGGTTYTAYQAAGIYEYTGLIPNTQYSFRMRARDMIDNVRTTSAVAVRTLANVPATLTATNGTHANKIVISWGANSNPSGTTYELQVSDDGTSGWIDLYVGTNTSYEHTGFTYNVTKYYRVRAQNGNNEYTSYATSVTGKTTVDITAPADFTVTATVNSSTKITVSGSTTDDLSGLHATPYAFSKDGGTTYTAYQAAGTYEYTGLIPNTEYSFRMRARDIFENLRTATVVKATTLANIPVSLTATNGTYANKIVVSWGANSNPSGTTYELQVSDNGTSGWVNLYVGANTSCEQTGLTYNVTKYYRVRAKNGSNVYTSYTANATGKTTVDITAPVDFTVTATVNSSTKITVSGSTTDAVSGLDTTPYAFSKDGGTTYTAYQAAGTYEYTGLIPNTEYSFRMRAKDALENIRTTAVVKATTLANVPVSLTATNGTYVDKITITWGANSNPGGTTYELQVSDDGTSGWANLYVGTNVSYEQTGLAYNVTKYYRVRAKNGSNVYTSYATSVTGKTTVDTTAPADFAITATANSSTKITVSGSTTDALSGLHATPYAFSKDGGTTYTAYQTAGTYEYTGLIPNTEYSFRMKARDVLGNVRATSIVMARTLVNIPNNLSATGGSTAQAKQITITWGANSNPSGTIYELEVSDNGTSEWTNLYTGTNITYVQTDLMSDSKITKYYKVRAKNGDNVYSGYTTAVSGNTLERPTGTRTVTSNGVNSGTVNITISWTAIEGAAGYNLYIFDGKVYRTIELGNVTSWESNQAKIYPTPADIAAWDVSSNPFKLDGTGTNYASSLNPLYMKSNGNYTGYSYYTYINLAARDAAGRVTGTANQSGAQKLNGTILDTDAPNTIGAPTVGTITGTSIQVTASTTDQYMTATYPGSGIPAATGYKHKAGTVESAWTTGTYIHTGLTPNTQYILSSKAQDARGNYTEYGATATARTLANIPNSLAATSGTHANKIVVTWGANSNPSGTIYELQVSDDGTSGWTNLYVGTNVSYEHTGLAYNVTKYYRVRAKNSDNVYTSYATSVTGKTTIDTTAPADFTVTAAVNSSTKITVSGSTTDALSGLHATPYAFSKDGGTTYTAYQVAGTYEYTGLIPNTEYSFRMRARDVIENMRTTSTVAARTLANIPTSLTATNGTHANKIVVSWGANSNPSGTTYELQVSDNGTSGWVNLYVGTNVNYEHTGLAYNATKYYRVRAKNNDNVYTSYTTNATGKTTIDTTAPVDFTVTATVNSSTKITVSGSTTDAVSGLHATPYAFSKDGGTTYTAYQSAGTYEYTGLIPNTEYSFRMRARDILENVRTTSTVAARTLANIPNNFVATNEAYLDKIIISWGANNNPSGTTYELQVSDNGTSGWVNLYVGTNVSYEHTGLTYNVTKYYRVRAKNGGNVYTSYTSGVVGKTIKDVTAPVITITPNVVEPNKASIITLTVTAADDYEVISMEDPSGNVVNNVPNETSMTITYNIIDNATYTFKATDINGNVGTQSITINNIAGFITKWTTTSNNTTIKLPIHTIAPNAYVNWGDGSAIQYVTTTYPSHTYAAAGTYEIEITGTVRYFGYSEAEAPGSSHSAYTFTQYLTGIKTWAPLGFYKIGFSQCTKLTGQIPVPVSQARVFANVTSFELLFHMCSSLTGTIPGNLFEGAVNATSFYGAFWNCPGLTGSIPENLLRDNVNATNIFGMFGYCTNLTGRIPEDLFRYTTEVTNFDLVFLNCQKLRGPIPADLFRYNTKVTSFNRTFEFCWYFEGTIPPTLFKYNTEVTSFYATFLYACCLDVITPDLFDYNLKVTNFTETFLNCLWLEGTVPSLWTRTSPTPSGTGCYANVQRVNSWQSIPYNWRVSGEHGTGIIVAWPPKPPPEE